MSAYNTRSEPLPSKGEGTTRHKAPRIGFLRPGHIERAFIVLLYLALLILVLLSVLGTFYGFQGKSIPLGTPAQILVDIQAGGIGIAVLIQLVLTLAQYGARQLSRHDRRWWFLYLAALSISVYYNFQAYWAPLTELMPVYVAGLIIIAGDVLPEFIAVRPE